MRARRRAAAMFTAWRVTDARLEADRLLTRHAQSEAQAAMLRHLRQGGATLYYAGSTDQPIVVSSWGKQWG